MIVWLAKSNPPSTNGKLVGRRVQFWLFFFGILTRTNLGHIWHASKATSKCARSMILQTDAKFSRGRLGNSTSDSLTWSSRERTWPQDYKENVNSILSFDESKSNLLLTQKSLFTDTRLLVLGLYFTWEMTRIFVRLLGMDWTVYIDLQGKYLGLT